MGTIDKQNRFLRDIFSTTKEIIQMFKRIYTTASLVALLAAGNAYGAGPDNSGNAPAREEVRAEATTSGDISKDAKKAWKNIKEDSSEAYESIKAMFVGDDKNAQFKQVVIDSRNTASGMLGKAVYNSQNERVGTVKDIIVDADGKARMLVIADYEVPGFNGKLAAFDYGVISYRNRDGDVIASVSEESINRAAEFSYDLKDAGDGKVRVIPTNGFAVSELLNGQLIDPANKSVADIDNIVFSDGHASQLIVGFDKILGLGGKDAVIDYDNTKLVRRDGELDFQLSATHTAQFEAYKKTFTN
jgi:sporulation protein YlmC with PRC-barrel domain